MRIQEGYGARREADLQLMLIGVAIGGAMTSALWLVLAALWRIA